MTDIRQLLSAIGRWRYGIGGEPCSMTRAFCGGLDFLLARDLGKCADGMHIGPRLAGKDAALSKWLGAGKDGMTLADPGSQNAKVHFEEMNDRRVILAALLQPRESRQLASLQRALKERLRRGH